MQQTVLGAACNRPCWVLRATDHAGCCMQQTVLGAACNRPCWVLRATGCARCCCYKPNHAAPPGADM
eukprot:365031-Chlamydomonas_euryale.AAC.3